MISALNRYNNVTQRIITGFFGIVLIVGAVFHSEWSYFGLFLIICIATQLEFYKLTGLDGMLPLKSAGCFAGALLYCISFLVERGTLDPKYYLLIFPVAASIFFIKLYKKSDKKPFTNIAYTLCGIFYVAVPFALLNIIAFSRGAYSFQIVIGVLSLFWASDTGAYFAGVRFGKNPTFCPGVAQKVVGGKYRRGGDGPGGRAYFFGFLPRLAFVAVDCGGRHHCDHRHLRRPGGVAFQAQHCH